MDQLTEPKELLGDDAVVSTESAEEKAELDQMISDYQKKNSASFIELRFSLGHKLMQNVCENQFDFLARNSFLCNRFCDYLASQEVTEASEAHMANLFKKVETMLNTKLEQFSHIASTEGIVIDAQNSRKRDYVKCVSSPLARRYMKLLEKADHTLLVCDALWLYDLMSQTEKQKLAGDIRNKMAGMARTIEYHKNHLLAQLNKRKKGGSTKAGAAKVDETNENDSAQGDSVAETVIPEVTTSNMVDTKQKKASKKTGKSEVEEGSAAGDDQMSTEENHLKVVNEG